jgi:hypothetical protein
MALQDTPIYTKAMPWTRRRWMGSMILAAPAPQLRSEESPVLIDNPKGNFQFLKGSGPYSSGAVASPGHEVVHVIFNPLPPLEKAFGLIEQHLTSHKRPIQALCGMELRIPKALSFEGFDQFNQPYIEKLKQWNLHVEGLNPVARTNVAIEVSPVGAPSVYGFCYTAPSSFRGKTFVVAGAGELRSGTDIVRQGDTSTEGMREKAKYVLDIMAGRLKDMGVAWADVTATNVYTVFSLDPLMKDTILPALGEAARHGVRWHYARPPIIGIDFEMDIRGVRQEMTLAG